MEPSKDKRRSDDEAESSARKSSKLSETNIGLNDIALSQVDQSDLNSLIRPIGYDNSIDCLLLCSRSDYGSLASVNRSFRSLIRGGELYKLRRKMGVTEHWVYFSRDLLKWEAFDPIRLRWMDLPRMLDCDYVFEFADKESLAVGTELLVFGRAMTSHIIYKYSILTNSWSIGTQMNYQRCLFGSASLGEIGIIAGGCFPNGDIVNLVEMYNSDNDTWVQLPSLHKPRKMCSGVFMDGKFYVIGGVGLGEPELLTCGEVYDMRTRTWTEIPNMFPSEEVQGGAPPLVAVVKNELYAAYHDVQEVRRYVKDSNSWVTVGRLPERARSSNGWGIAFRALGDSLVVVGGPLASHGGVDEINTWVPNEDPVEWRTLASKPSGSFVFCCTVMGC